MIRALSAPRAVGAPSGRVVVRVTRRRYATEPPTATPKKKKSIVRRLLFYTAAGTATFYVGSAFVAFKYPPYHDVFVQQVPLGAAVVQYGEDNDWDTVTLEKVITLGKGVYNYVQGLVTGQERGDVLQRAKDAMGKTKETVVHSVEASTEAIQDAVQNRVQETKDRVKQAAETMKTSVKKTDGGMAEKSARAAKIFSDGVEDLVRKAEAALAGRAPQPGDNEAETSPKSGNVYGAPLPIGFEPPPGYTRPAPPKKAPTQATPAKPAPAPLPLVAPAVMEFGASEPVIAQLASVIDNLASFLNTNPSAAEKARDILDTAKVDLTSLATRIDQVKAEERTKLEARLDEQTREYTLKLLELEMEGQDKLDSQEQDFRKFFDEERMKFVQAYREKLNRELQTQSEIINERLKEEVIAQGIELQRRWIRDIKVRVEQERGGRLAKLDELATNLKRLERIALDNSAFLDENIRIHALWSALRALTHNVDAPVRKPFREELRVLRHLAAAREDSLVSSVLESLESSDVPDVGVEPFADLATWFTTSVAPAVSSVALVPDQDAGVLSHLASHLVSTFTFRRQGLVPGDDVLSVLARAEYHLNEKDLDSAARELNQLKGPAKVLLSDWLDAARRRLEVLQALEVAQAQATLASLLVAQD
ncbi:mitochondrial inner membrane protein Mitofilin [Fomitopsis serialis]|uniref:mitochondrial inner membrane protein Mitofilin n=1 Tax=Fomitopsis serialis TaxID=139415 RepID=UPI002007EEFB|nr:mitochondrial inner membrane protein Mitofilin [Neoantrodia serialis]KAH9928372.1 mitochondrial inner membrane protein Mitofilin [Neoantrodia serialis]